MKRTLLSLATVAALGLSAPLHAADALMERANTFFQPIPANPPALKDNAVTHDKVELGKMIFFEPRLSNNHMVSCNTCHNLGMGGDDNLEVSPGHGWTRGHRNAPTVFNSVFNVAQSWDGRSEDLKAQAKGLIRSGLRMYATPEVTVETLSSMPEYHAAFAKAFPGESNPLTFENLAKALEAFEASLITPASRFDQFLEGNAAALSEQEKTGLSLFMENGCASCHNGVNVGGQAYFSFGLAAKPGADILPPDDKGRYAVTETAVDNYVFRAPPLRNVELTAPYFHSGKVWSLEQAVDIMGRYQLGTELKDEEVKAIAAFLRTLTGEIPRIELPQLPVSTDATPKPTMR